MPVNVNALTHPTYYHPLQLPVTGLAQLSNLPPFAAGGPVRLPVLGPVLGRVGRLGGGRVRADSRRRHPGAAGGDAGQHGDRLLQGGGEAAEGVGDGLFHPTGAADRWGGRRVVMVGSLDSNLDWKLGRRC